MDIDSFLDRYTVSVPESGCALWLKHTSRHGYGVVGKPGMRGTMAAHRLAYTLAFGEIPPGNHVCHRCDVRSCVRPDHLFIGSAADNRIDCARKGRHKWPVFHGSAHPMAKLSRAQVDEIRASDESNKTIAVRYGISRGHAWEIRRGFKWSAP